MGDSGRILILWYDSIFDFFSDPARKLQEQIRLIVPSSTFCTAVEFVLVLFTSELSFDSVWSWYGKREDFYSVWWWNIRRFAVEGEIKSHFNRKRIKHNWILSEKDGQRTSRQLRQAVREAKKRFGILRSASKPSFASEIDPTRVKSMKYSSESCQRVMKDVVN